MAAVPVSAAKTYLPALDRFSRSRRSCQFSRFTILFEKSMSANTERRRSAKGRVRQYSPDRKLAPDGVGSGLWPPPRHSDIHLLGDGQGIVNLNTKVADRALELGVSEQ